jgi:hypothetical protein
MNLPGAPQQITASGTQWGEDHELGSQFANSTAGAALVMLDCGTDSACAASNSAAKTRLIFPKEKGAVYGTQSERCVARRLEGW